MAFDKLSPAFVTAVRHTGKTRSAERYADGHGLMLCVQPSGSKNWIQRLVIHGRRRSFGLGGFPLVSLQEARQAAFENRKVARQGGDPLALRVRRDVPDFATAAATVIAMYAGGWKASGRSRTQWENSLSIYVLPHIGAKRVDAITSFDVLAVLRPIWATKRETARRVRSRISIVMRWAIAQNYRVDDPAAAAVLQALPKHLPTPQRHHPALPHDKVAGALQRVRESGAWRGTKLAFELLVLTAVRSGEVRGATWDEIDFDAATWTVPAARMKARVAHRVPLVPRSLEILAEAKSLVAPRPTNNVVFPSLRGKVQADAAMSRLLLKLGVPAVPHGMRSSFRDWAAERGTQYEVIEAALAHVVRSAVVRAYARSDFFDMRRPLMEQWAQYVAGPKT